MTSDQFLIYSLIGIVALVIYYIITQWIHQIHKRNRYLKAQTELLAKIAEKQGVNKDEIEVILSVARRPDSIL
jgi:hypothetical protein